MYHDYLCCRLECAPKPTQPITSSENLVKTFVSSLQNLLLLLSESSFFLLILKLITVVLDHVRFKGKQQIDLRLIIIDMFSFDHCSLLTMITNYIWPTTIFVTVLNNAYWCSFDVRVDGGYTGRFVS